jgi:hypothetical protein
VTAVPCPACDLPVVFALGSRHGGRPVPFDPEPGTGSRFDTLLSPDLSHVARNANAAAALKGRVPLYRPHMWTCPAGMRIPADRPLPAAGGYSHVAAGQLTGPLPSAPDPAAGWRAPWEGITGEPRPALGDLLSLAEDAGARRAVMAGMAVCLYHATAGGTLLPACTRMAARIRGPRPGDLVAEVTTAGTPGSSREGLGVLIACRPERPGPSPDGACSRLGAALPGDDAWYVQFGPGPGDVARWTAARFIAALAGDREFGD